jgi:nucleoside-diphosphate-sugar epimerase
VISLFISALCAGRRPTIYGDGEQSRDFTYVSNVVDGVLRAAQAPDVSGEVINVATGSAVTINQLFQTVRSILGSDLEPRYAPARQGDVRESRADLDKALRLLGYRPSMAFDEGLARTVTWHQSLHAAGRV